MTKKKTQTGQLINIAFNVAIPAFIMTRFSDNPYLSPTATLVVALLFPVAYGSHQMLIEKTLNFFSVIGFISTLLTGLIGILKLETSWIAIKEAGIPLALGLAVVLSQRTKYPLVRTFLNEMIDLKKIDKAFEKSKKPDEFETKISLFAFVFGGAYLVSAVLNFILAVVVVTADPGSIEYTQQIGKMTAISYPVIALPMMLITSAGLFVLYRSVRTHTNLSLEEIFYQ